MASIDGLSNKELKELIVENLKEVGIDPDPIQIKIRKSSQVILRGTVDSSGEKALIMQTIKDVMGIDNISDGLIVLEGLDEDISENDTARGDEDTLFDEDNERIGTKDVFRSVEDGLPYIPPTTLPFKESPRRRKRRPRKKRSDNH